MYSVAVNSSLFIAHSLPHPDFGPAQNLHGATLDITVRVFRQELNDAGVVIDIGYLTGLLDKLVEKYNYGNLDTYDEFEEELTTIDYLCGYFHKWFVKQLQSDEVELGSGGIARLSIRIDESRKAWATYARDL